jgi:hypothetical protein
MQHDSKSKMLAMVIAGFILFASCNNDDYTKGPTKQPENIPGDTDTTISNPPKKDTLPTASEANHDSTTKKK